MVWRLQVHVRIVRGAGLLVMALGAATAPLLAEEGLDELSARTARIGSTTWPTDALENASTYTYQPETVMYHDSVTGHEVWIVTRAPNREEIFSREHGTNVWSFDGSRIGLFNPNCDRPSRNPSRKICPYLRRWIVNTDGSDLRFAEGYGRREIPFDGFGWAHNENAFFSFGSGPAEATDSSELRLYKNRVGAGNAVTGTVVLDTASINALKKDLVKDGISTDDSHAVFRDASLTGRWLPTPNPIPNTAVYFATLSGTPGVNRWWGVARMVGPSTNHWADPYGNHVNSAEGYFHDVWSPGPTGTWIVGQYPGSRVFSTYKRDGSAADGGPLWADWNGSGWGTTNEIQIVSDDGGGPHNPYNLPYFGHPAWDRWGRYAVVGTYTDVPRPGTRIYDDRDKRLLPNWVLADNKYDGQHHSWTGWTDQVIGVDPVDLFLYSNRFDAEARSAVKVANTHYTGSGSNYQAYPRPSQSPDGTKVAFAQSFLNGTEAKPYIAWAVVAYPKPPTQLVAIWQGGVRLSWAAPRYTTRGWPDESRDPPPAAREVKGYHVWRAASAAGPWTELTTMAVAERSYTDTTAPSNAVSYYAVTSEEWSRLESDQLSEVLSVTVGSGSISATSKAAEAGTRGFWTSKPPAPTDLAATRQSAAGQVRLDWAEPGDSKIRYYNVYYSATATPKAVRQRRIASVPVGTRTFLDWLADPGTAWSTQPAYYAVTSVDRHGNESVTAAAPIGGYGTEGTGPATVQNVQRSDTR